MDDKASRLVAAARKIWTASNDSPFSEMADWSDEFQELYNAMRNMTGEPCDHDWFPKAGPVGGKMFTYCGKCGCERAPDDPGIKVRRS